RFAEVVDSVIQALNAASLALEPKKDITQSRVMIAATARATPCTAWAPPSGRTSPKVAVVAPHSTYPTAMNGRRRPTRSEAAPINSVAHVAVAADAATKTAIT